MIHVLLVDDHALFAEGLAALLRQSDTISVLPICTSAGQVMPALEAYTPDVVLLDINLGNMDGVTLCRHILYQYPALHIIAVTMHHEPRFVRDMKEAGAKGYLQKHAEHSEVIEAIQLVHAGGVYFIEQPKKDVPTQSGLFPGSVVDLNPKEKRILDGVLAGKTSRQIAEALGVSLKTVEFYRNSLFVKFDVKNVVELINKARHYA